MTLETKPAPATRVQRHPVSGALNGAMVGLSVAIYRVLFSVEPFMYETIGRITAIGAAIGLLWGVLAPARKVKDVAPPFASYSPVFTRSASAEEEALPTYEATFGSGSSVSGGTTEDSGDGGRKRASVGGFFGG